MTAPTTMNPMILTQLWDTLEAHGAVVHRFPVKELTPSLTAAYVEAEARRLRIILTEGGG